MKKVNELGVYFSGECLLIMQKASRIIPGIAKSKTDLIVFSSEFLRQGLSV